MYGTGMRRRYGRHGATRSAARLKSAFRSVDGSVPALHTAAATRKGGRHVRAGVGEMTTFGSTVGGAVATKEASAAPAAVVFDLDGVLVDSLAVMRAAFTHAYRTVVNDGEPPFDEYCNYLGWLFSDIMRAMGLPLEMEAPFVAESSRLIHDVPVYPGVASMLEQLAGAGVAVGVATGKTGTRARALLHAKGL